VNSRAEAALLVVFRAELGKQHAFREGRPFVVWHDREIEFMHELVNAERKKLGRSEISRNLVERAESCASGHTDYALKFALYCRDLVFDDRARP
jgi:hypothetical protein